MYFYYWIPSKRHIDCKRDKFPLKIFDRVLLPDIYSKDNYILYVIIDRESYDLSIRVVRDRKLIKRVVLKSIKIDKNGFFIYKSDENLTREDITLIEIQAYHIFKGFFHKHEYHKEHIDTLIKAYSSIEMVPARVYIKHYIDLYIDKFNAFKTQILQHPADRIEQEFNRTKDITKAKELLSMANHYIFIAQGEMVYATFLLECSLDYKDSKELYRESKIYLNMYERELNILYNSYSTLSAQISLEYDRLSNRLQIILAFIGILIGVLSII